MIDHISLRVSDYDRSRAFYLAALAPLGYSLAMEIPTGAGFRRGPIPSFWIKAGTPPQLDAADADLWGGCGGPQLHVAFSADSREMVEAFFQAAMAAGAREHGAPALQPQYHPNYYGAFVLDPDGYNIEAVCHRPE